MSENIINRFKEFLEDKNISASELSEKIGVQRSSISHIMSGRNKPSLDFVVKLLDHYPDLNIYWLLNNRGSKYKDSHSPSPSDSKKIVKSPKDMVFNQKEKLNLNNDSSKKIKHIAIFYEDGTFDYFEPN